MADRLTKKQRSAHMARIRSKRTGPEMALHGKLKGLKWTHRMWPDIHGHPDVLIDEDIVVFVNGCFWHGCPQHWRCPKTNRSFWTQKIIRNAERQAEVLRELRRSGYRVVVVWEHELKKTTIDAAIDRIRVRMEA
jgi:DNA mismatch endonuclease (patch repair protein)